LTAACRTAWHDRLIDVDEAWQRCCDAAELPRRSYEEEVVSRQAAYRTLRTRFLAEYSGALKEAWATYKQQVAGAPAIGFHAAETAPSVSRRAVIADARAQYDGSATTIRHSYDERMASAHGVYLRGLQEALSVYEAEVNHELVTYRATIKGLRKDFGPSGDAGPVTARGSPAPPTIPRADSDFDTAIAGLISSSGAEAHVSLRV
jgi:hypothetical protein